MLVTSLVVLGVFSFRDLGVDLFPKADPATVNVTLRLPGASPDEMTSSVVIPMENALSGIAGIEELPARVTTGGTASLNIRFVLEQDLDDAANSVREKVAGAMRSVPPEVLPPIIQKHDPDADPIMSLVLLVDKTASLRALTELADKQIKRALESVDGVGQVTMIGDRPREIHVNVDLEQLNAHGLSIDQVRDAIQQENVEVPGGTLEQGEWEVGPADAGSHRCRRPVQRRHHRHGRRHAAPGVRHRPRRGHRESGDVGVPGRRQPRGAARHPARLR